MKRNIQDLIAEPCGIILEKKRLASLIYELTVYAPAIVHNAQPGQFVIAIEKERDSKPVPLTIADIDRSAGTITLVVQAVKKYSTRLLTMEVGEKFFALQGPTGHPSEIKKYDGTVVCVAGGVGAAPMYPVVRALAEAGNDVHVIIGAREYKYLFWYDKFVPLALAYGKITLCIEEGEVSPYHVKGRVTLPLEALLANKEKHIARVFAAGPIPMLKAISKLTIQYGVPNTSSAVAQMIDGTGMCGGCQCNVGGKKVLLCQHGPEIDGNLADWDTLNTRLNSCRPEEDAAMAEFAANDPAYRKFLKMEGLSVPELTQIKKEI